MSIIAPRKDDSMESEISIDFNDGVKNKSMVQALRQQFDKQGAKSKNSDEQKNNSNDIGRRVVPDVQDMEKGLLMPDL